MALSTYSELQAAVADWLQRGDLTTQIPDFIALCEARLNREVRFRQQIQRATTEFSDQYITLPGDYAEIKDMLLLSNPPRSLIFITMQRMDDLKISNATGTAPYYFTIVGNTLELYPVGGDCTGEMTYYKQIPALSVDSTNWLLTKHPDIYLYGTLLQAAPYLRDDDRALVWETLYQKAISEAEVENQNATHGSKLVMRSPISRSD